MARMDRVHPSRQWIANSYRPRDDAAQPDMYGVLGDRAESYIPGRGFRTCSPVDENSADQGGFLIFAARPVSSETADAGRAASFPPSDSCSRDDPQRLLRTDRIRLGVPQIARYHPSLGVARDAVASHAELVDVFERVLTRGVVVEIAKATDAASDRDASASFRLSIAGVDVVEVGAGVSWRYLSETDE